MKAWKRSEFEQLLSSNGFEFVRQSGSHKVYKCKGKKDAVVPLKLNKMIALRIIKECGLLT